MKRTLLAAAFLAIAAPAAFAQDLTGTYSVAGTNLNGTPYAGQAEITLLSDTTCQIEWTTGTSTSTGICMRYGPAFAAAYVLNDAVGLVIYQILDDGTLDGTWTIAGMEGAGTEVLTPM